MQNSSRFLKKTSFLYVSLVICFFGCSLIFEDIHIAPEKLPLIRPGDKLLFTNSIEIDSFVVIETTFYEANEISDYEQYIARIVEFGCNDSCFSFDVFITPGDYIIGYNETFSYKIADKVRGYSDLSLQIGDYELDDIYRIYNFKTDSITGAEITEEFYSKKYGVIEYHLSNGDVFKLSEESLAMLIARE